MRRLETGSLVAALGGLLLLVSLFLVWFPPSLNAWDAFEVWDLVLAGLGVAVIGVAAGELGWWGGPLPPVEILVAGVCALVIVAAALLNHPPAALGSPVARGAWAGLGGAVLMVAGGVMSRFGISVSFSVDPGPRPGRPGTPGGPTPDGPGSSDGAAAAPPVGRPVVPGAGASTAGRPVASGAGPSAPAAGRPVVPGAAPGAAPPSPGRSGIPGAAPGPSRSGVPGAAPPPPGRSGIPGAAPPPIPGGGGRPVDPAPRLRRAGPSRRASGASGPGAGAPPLGVPGVPVRAGPAPPASPETPSESGAGRRWPRFRRAVEPPEDETDVTERLPGDGGGLGPPPRR